MDWLLPDCLTLDRCRRHGWTILLLLTILLYLPGMRTLPLMDRDEPRFARATVEMVERGSWAVPYFNDAFRFDKPPLTYWWMALHHALLGVNEASSRLHSIVATWLVSLAVAGFVRRLADARRALIAAIAWLTTWQVLVHGRLCVADMPMVLAVTWTMRAIFEIFDAEAPGLTPWTRWHTVLYVSLGIGFLAKGPVAWLVPAVALVLHRFAFLRRPMVWRRLHALPGLAIALAIVAAWGVPALIETRGAFWNVGMGEHVVDRGVRALNGRFVVPGYYVATSLLSLFPWVGLLPAVWKQTRAEWDAGRSLCMAWLAAPYLIFSFYSTQLPHYVMPGFPAAIMLLVLGARPGAVASRWAVFVAATWILLASTAGVALITFPWSAELRPIIHSGVLLLAACSLLGLAVVASRTSAPAARGVFASGLLVLAIGIPHLSTAIRGASAAVRLEKITTGMPADARLISCVFAEPSLVFHCARHWDFEGDVQRADEVLAAHSHCVIVVQRREWTLSQALQHLVRGERPEIPAKDTSAQADELARRHGLSPLVFSVFNPARCSWTELAVLPR